MIHWQNSFYVNTWLKDLLDAEGTPTSHRHVSTTDGVDVSTTLYRLQIFYFSLRSLLHLVVRRRRRRRLSSRKRETSQKMCVRVSACAPEWQQDRRKKKAHPVGTVLLQATQGQPTTSSLFLSPLPSWSRRRRRRRHRIAPVEGRGTYKAYPPTLSPSFSFRTTDVELQEEGKGETLFAASATAVFFFGVR